MSDHCTYPYPNWAEAQPAFKTLLSAVTGETVEVGCLVHCGYTALGFCASMAFPHEPHVHELSAESGMTDNAMLEAVANWDGASRMAIDWKRLAKFVFEILIKFAPLVV